MKKKLSKLNIIFIVVISVLVVAVTTLTILLCYKEELSYYDMKCESFEVQNANLSKGQIIFIGDSITDLYPLDNYYADLDLAVYNRGIGGDTTVGVKNRLDLSLFDLAPSKIVLMIGTNDINGLRSVNDILVTYEEIVATIYEKLPNIDLYIMSVIPQNYDLESYTNINVDNSMERINELNKGIIQIANKYNSTYFDLYSLLLDDSGMLDKNYSSDGIHLNEKGFIIWTNLIKEHLVD